MGLAAGDRHAAEGTTRGRRAAVGHSDQVTCAHWVLWKSWVFSFGAHELRASSEDVSENVGRQVRWGRSESHRPPPKVGA